MNKIDPFQYFNKKLLSRINLIALCLTSICEVFAIMTFKYKAFSPDLERWKYLALLFGLILVSLLFIISVLLFIYFLKSKKR